MSKARDFDAMRSTLKRPRRIDPMREVAINTRGIPHKTKQEFKAVCAKSGISMHHALNEYIEMCISQGEALTVLYYELQMENKVLTDKLAEAERLLEESL